MSGRSIKEVAALAGFSPATVSIVLNGKPGVSEATRKKVQAVIDELDYAPNPNPRRLRLNKTFHFVLLHDYTQYIDDSFYVDLNHRLLIECSKANYDLVHTSKWAEDGSLMLPDTIRARDVDGIIATSALPKNICDSIAELKIPMVFVDCYRPSEQFGCVVPDYRQIGASAVQSLLSRGHRDIAYFGDYKTVEYSALLDGYLDAMALAGIEPRKEWIMTECRGEQDVDACIGTLREQAQQPTAIFCCADIYAINVIRSLKKRGVPVPGNVSVISVDDIKLARYMDPALTTVHVNREEMGRMAVQQLLAMLDGAAPVEYYVTNNYLVERESVQTMGSSSL